MKKYWLGVGVLTLLFLSIIIPKNSLAASTEDAINHYGDELFDKSTTVGDENFNPNTYIEKEEKDAFTPSKKEDSTIPYQEVPKIPRKIESNPGKAEAVEGGNEKAVNPLATKENKARGTVKENVDRNGQDITPYRKDAKNSSTTKVIKDPNGELEKEKTYENNPKNQPELIPDESKELDVRQFLTFQTKSGKTFHLIVDHGKNSENVQLLTEVGEQDLINMIEGEKPKQIEQKEEKSIEELQSERKAREEAEKIKAEEVSKEKETKKSSPLFLILIVLAVAGAGYYFKIYKPKQESEYYDEEDDNEEEYEDFENFDEYLEEDEEDIE
ncbi:MAG: CD1107 family mobile element protein [Peptoniphilaceae bacterium]